MTANTDNGQYHHTSYARGYIPVGTIKRVPYQGRYGKGVKVFSHNPNSTYYCCVSYYIDTPPMTTGEYTREITDISNPAKVYVLKRTEDGHYYLKLKDSAGGFQRVNKNYLKTVNICL